VSAYQTPADHGRVAGETPVSVLERRVLDGPSMVGWGLWSLTVVR